MSMSISELRTRTRALRESIAELEGKANRSPDDNAKLAKWRDTYSQSMDVIIEDNAAREQAARQQAHSGAATGSHDARPVPDALSARADALAAEMRNAIKRPIPTAALNHAFATHLNILPAELAAREYASNATLRARQTEQQYRANRVADWSGGMSIFGDGR